MRRFKDQPYFLLLLPVFFVLHGYAEHFAYIGTGDILKLVFVYCIASVILYFLSYLLFRDRTRAALFATSLMAFYFFFGAIYDFTKAHSPVRFLNKYSVLLSIFALLIIVLLIYLMRARHSLKRVSFFLNVLLVIYIGVDLVTIGWKSTHPENAPVSSPDLAKANSWKIPDTCHKPDIYFLLFDEYTNSISLKNIFGFDNSNFDSTLVANRFYLARHSTSNYFRTVASMASTLNMDYLEEMNNNKEMTRDDVLRCFTRIRESRVAKFLELNGYQVVNLSIFDLAGNPAPVNQGFLPTRTRMITEGTLFSRLARDFEWWITMHGSIAHFFPVHTVAKQDANNQYLLQQVKEAASVKQPQPRFIYSHFMLPHLPFFRDRYGNKRPDSVLSAEALSWKPPASSYLEYVLYTNEEIKKLVSTIHQQTDSSAVMIVMSDHGFRDLDDAPLFSNLNAIYLPGQRYGQFYDSISNVNQFRVLFNTLFDQHFPLQKDTSWFIP